MKQKLISLLFIFVFLITLFKANSQEQKDDRSIFIIGFTNNLYFTDIVSAKSGGELYRLEGATLNLEVQIPTSFSKNIKYIISNLIILGATFDLPPLYNESSMKGVGLYFGLNVKLPFIQRKLSYGLMAQSQLGYSNYIYNQIDDSYSNGFSKIYSGISSLTKIGMFFSFNSITLNPIVCFQMIDSQNSNGSIIAYSAGFEFGIYFWQEICRKVWETNNRMNPDKLKFDLPTHILSN